MAITYPVTGLQAEWLRRFHGLRSAPRPADVLEALISVGMIAATADGHKISPAGNAFLEPKT